MGRRRPVAVVGASRNSGEFVLTCIAGVIVLTVVMFLALAGVGAGLTYYVTSTNNPDEAVNPQSYLLASYIPLSFTDRSGGQHDGWFLLGSRGTPVIILCHGYNSNRSDLLPLGTVLRDNHFNVYLFNFHGPKARESLSDLGARQASDLMAAIETVARQPDVNPNRIGLFGTSVGGYAVLVAAEQNSRVKALVVDNTYSTPQRMFESQIDRLLGGSSGLFHALTDAEFRLATLGSSAYAMPTNLTKLAIVPKLFIFGRDSPVLAAMTEELYDRAPLPKQALVMEHSLAGLTTQSETKEYDNQVLNFFLQKLSLRPN